MRKIVAGLVLAVVMVVMALPVFAVGSVTTVAAGDNPTKYTLSWTSDASGNVTSNTSAIRVGNVFKIEIVPNGGGTQPTNLYDVTLLDANSVDLLSGVGADQSNAASKVFVFDPQMWHDDTALTLTVANAGNAKGGTVYLWVR